MSLDQMRDSPALFQQRLLAHFGLPAPKPAAVAPARNIAAEQGRLGYAVRAIDCATKQRLAAFYRPWRNVRLFHDYPSLGGAEKMWNLSATATVESKTDRVPCEVGLAQAYGAGSEEIVAAADEIISRQNHASWSGSATLTRRRAFI